VLERDRDGIPLCEAVTRRLGVESWMLRLDAAGRVRGVIVLAADFQRGRGPARARAGVHHATTPALAPPRPCRTIRSNGSSHSAGGPIARLLGGTQATGRQLADLALHSDDPEIRGEAVGVVVDGIMREPGPRTRVWLQVSTASTTRRSPAPFAASRVMRRRGSSPSSRSAPGADRSVTARPVSARRWRPDGG
jgi:hypothetical protein